MFIGTYEPYIDGEKFSHFFGYKLTKWYMKKSIRKQKVAMLRFLMMLCSMKFNIVLF